MPQIQFDSAGLSSLRHAGSEWLARGDFQVNRVSFSSAAGQRVDGSRVSKLSISPKFRQTILAFDWGRITVSYIPQPGRLTVRVRTSNQGKSVLETLSYDLLALRLPGRPKEYDGRTPLLETNLGAPTSIALSYGAGAITLCNDDVKRPLLLGFPWANDKPVNTVFPIRINTGRDTMYPDSLPTIERPIAAGGTDEFDISLRFSSPPSRTRTVAPDLSSVFAAVNPFTLKWTDRRPIGSLILATAATKWPKNPRGWFLDPKLDVTTAAGVAEFRQRLLAWADRSVTILKAMNAQGMVTWDIEGEQFPHATTYIGDPRLAERLAPEMNGVSDEYFARFTRAGLRVGLTIRPQTIELSGTNQNARQLESPDPARVLIDKIAYAKKRWGATLFYIDSNGDQVLPLSFSVLKRVAAAHPDVLLMPEHKNAVYYSKTAPYSELRGGYASTPALVKDIYPEAFSVINIADGQPGQHAAQLEKAVARGDILMFRAWFDDPINKQLKALTGRNASYR